MIRLLLFMVSALLMQVAAIAQPGAEGLDDAYLNEMRIENAALTERIKAESAGFQELNKEAGNNMRIQDYDGALKAAAKMEQLSPVNADVKHFKGKLFAKLGKYDEAVKSFDDAIRLSPKNKWFYIHKATLQADNNKLEDALETIDRLIAKYPQWSIGYNVKAAFLKAQHKNNDALTAYTAAVKAKPESAQVFTNRGNLYLELGNRAKAMEDYKKALQIQPNYGAAKVALENAN